MDNAAKEGVSISKVIFIVLVLLLVIGTFATIFYRAFDTTTAFLDDSNSQVELAKQAGFYTLAGEEKVLVTVVTNSLHEGSGIFDMIQVGNQLFVSPAINIQNGQYPGLQVSQVDEPATAALSTLLAYTDRYCRVTVENAGILKLTITIL